MVFLFLFHDSRKDGPNLGGIQIISTSLKPRLCHSGTEQSHLDLRWLSMSMSNLMAINGSWASPCISQDHLRYMPCHNIIFQLEATWQSSLCFPQLLKPNLGEVLWITKKNVPAHAVPILTRSRGIWNVAQLHQQVRPNLPVSSSCQTWNKIQTHNI